MMAAPGIFLRKSLGQEGGEDVAADDLGLLIDEDAAVGVAVEADAEVGGIGEDGFLKLAQVGVDQGVGLVFEDAGDFGVEGDDLEVGLADEDVGDELAGHAVGAIDDDLERAFEVEELEDVGLVGAGEVHGFDAAGLGGRAFAAG